MTAPSPRPAPTPNPERGHAFERPGALFQAVGASLPNRRGRTWQDRFAAGCDDRAAWAVVADGIGGARDGDIAARVAVNAVRTALSTLTATKFASGSLEDVCWLAQAAVRGVFPEARGDDGGCTLTIAVVTATDVHIACLGDSPAYTRHESGWQQVTPPTSGPLRAWIGQPDALHVWQTSWPVAPERAVAVAVCSDGVRPDGLPVVDDPAAVVSRALEEGRNDDDATAVVITRLPLGSRPIEMTLVSIEELGDAPRNPT